MLVTLNFPTNLQKYEAGAGAATPRSFAPLVPNALGQVVVDASVVNIDTLLASGFTPAMLSGTTAARPVITYAGQFYLDTTLGYLVVRNAGNTGWQNSTGSLV